MGAGTSVYSRPSGTQSRPEKGIGDLPLVGQWVQPDGGDFGLYGTYDIVWTNTQLPKWVRGIATII